MSWRLDYITCASLFTSLLPKYKVTSAFVSGVVGDCGARQSVMFVLSLRHISWCFLLHIEGRLGPITLLYTDVAQVHTSVAASDTSRSLNQSSPMYLPLDE